MYIKSAKIKPHHIPCIMLNNKQLSYVDSYKYLGCIISNDCRDNMDIKKHIRGLQTCCQDVVFIVQRLK